MHCSGCERNLEFALESLDGIENARADHDDETVVVDFNDGALGEERIVQAIEDMGYDVEAA
jgi:copper chaperone CopZ